MDMTQEDIRAAGDLGERLCSLCEYSRMGEITKAFAAHRQAALLEGVRIGLAAAADDAVTWFPEATTGKYRAGGVVGSIRALDHATVLARHGGA